MAHFVGLDKPRGTRYFVFWKVAFFVALFLVGLFFYKASVANKYNWQWGRVGQYFWVTSESFVTADADGELAQILKEDNALIAVVKDSSTGAEQRYILPSHAEMRLTKGGYAYMGDTIAAYRQSKPGIFLNGLFVTFQVSIFAIVIGIVLGIGTGLCRLSQNPFLRWGAITYIEIVRGSPLNVQLFLVYYVVGPIINPLIASFSAPLRTFCKEYAVTLEPNSFFHSIFFGIGDSSGQITAFWFGVIVLGLFAGAYVAEIVRAGIQSVHRGQMEAGRSLGLTNAQTMQKIILPQAFRRIMPPLAGQFISLIKDSSLLGAITIVELTKATREAASSSVMAFEPWIICGALYLVLTFTLSLLVQQLERRAIR